MFKLIASFSLLLGVTLYGQTTRQQKEWKDYSYPEKGFTISAPSPPNVHPDPEANDVTIYSWQLRASLPAVIHVGDRPNCKQLVAVVKVALLNGPKNTSDLYLKDVTVDGNAGLQSVETKGGFRVRESIYCVGEKAFSLTGKWHSGEQEPSVLKRWFNSFHFLPRNAH